MDIEVLILRCLYTVILIFGLSTNILLLVAVFRRRKASNLKPFSIFVAEMAIFDILGVIATWINMPSIHMFNFTGLTSYRLYGVSEYFGPTVGYILHAVYGHIAGNVPLIIIISFAVKYYSIVKRQPSTEVSLVLAVVAYIPAVIYLIFYPTCLATDPEIPNDGTLIWFNRSVFRFKIVKLSFIGLWVITTASSFFFRWLILQALNKFCTTMSERTAKMHRMVVRALTLQALTPLISLTTIVALLFEPIQEGDVLRGSLRFLINSSITTIHASVPLFFIGSYRKAIFRRKPAENDTTLGSTHYKIPTVRVTP